MRDRGRTNTGTGDSRTTRSATLPISACAAPVRPEVGKHLKDAQALLKGAKYKEALAKLRDAEGVSGRNADENAYLEQLRDSAQTQGLLPKVIASYNAGPSPVEAWNTAIRDNGDPLLYIESIPYWETRGYVMTVLRNYWMYEAHDGRKSASREALVQGLWPRFPGLPGPAAVKIGAHANR